jgi:hypothetical protein
MLELKKPNEKQRKLISHSVWKCHFAAAQQMVAFGCITDVKGVGASLPGVGCQPGSANGGFSGLPNQH